MSSRKRGRKGRPKIGYEKARDRYYFSWMVNGKRTKRFFSSMRQAEKALDEIYQDVEEVGSWSEEITPEDRALLPLLKRKLEAAGCTLEEAVTLQLEAAASEKIRLKGRAFAEVAAEFKAVRADLNYAEGTTKQMNAAINAFSETFATWDIRRIELDDVQDWFRSNFDRWEPRTQKGYRGCLKKLWSWAAEPGREWVAADQNPFRQVEIQNPDFEEDPEFFSVKQCRQLLRRVAQEDPEFIPFVVLGMFCGIRSECELDVEGGVEVNLEKAVVRVRGGKRRSRRRRFVPLDPAAVAWLKWYEGALPDPVAPQTNFRKRWERVRPQDYCNRGMRHTYATYHYAKYANEFTLQSYMGHHDAEVLHQNYRGLADEHEAEDFWNLTPEVVLGISEDS